MYEQKELLFLKQDVNNMHYIKHGVMDVTLTKTNL